MDGLLGEWDYCGIINYYYLLLISIIMNGLSIINIYYYEWIIIIHFIAMLYLVGGLEHQFYCPINIGLLIIPIDFHIFQRG